MWKEVVMNYFRALSQDLHKETEEATKHARIVSNIAEI